MLTKGDIAPNFKAKTQHGKTFELSKAKKPLILYFYPKDFTPGCTKQACLFRDGTKALKGIPIFGVSMDSAETHKRFAAQYNIPFALLADVDDSVCELYGVKRLWGIIPFTRRVSFLIGKDGRVAHVVHAELDIQVHLDELSEAVKRL